jgi:hypothetical protein
MSFDQIKDLVNDLFTFSDSQTASYKGMHGFGFEAGMAAGR